MIIQDIPKKILDKICSNYNLYFDGTFLITHVGMRSFLIYSTDLSDYRFGLKSYFEIIEFAQKLSGDSGQNTNSDNLKIIKSIHSDELEDFGVFTEVDAIHLATDKGKEVTIIEIDGMRKLFPSFIFGPLSESLRIDSLDMLEIHFPELVEILKELHERENMAS